VSTSKEQPPEQRQRTVTRWLPGFVALSAIWGSSFALIKIAVDDGVPPLWVALWRCLFGALALLAVCAIQRAPMPRDVRTWGHAAVVAALLNAVPFALFAIGEQYVSSVLAGVINATTPLMTLIFVVALVPGEQVTLRRVLGLLLGFAGVLCLLGVWRGLVGGTVTGALACLGATACYGAGFAYTRRFFSGRQGSAAALSAAQIAAATVELTVVAAATGTSPTLPGATASIALVVLGTVGTGYAFLLNLQVIRAAGPTVASTVTYVVPIWSTLIGVTLLAEPVGWNTVLGGFLVICGILVARSRRDPDRRPVIHRLRWWVLVRRA
jgi:drug/metabolite transporter (DMT)-like permease